MTPQGGGAAAGAEPFPQRMLSREPLSPPTSPLARGSGRSASSGPKGASRATTPSG